MDKTAKLKIRVKGRIITIMAKHDDKINKAVQVLRMNKLIQSKIKDGDLIIMNSYDLRNLQLHQRIGSIDSREAQTKQIQIEYKKTQNNNNYIFHNLQYDIRTQQALMSACKLMVNNKKEQLAHLVASGRLSSRLVKMLGALRTKFNEQIPEMREDQTQNQTVHLLLEQMEKKEISNNCTRTQINLMNEYIVKIGNGAVEVSKLESQQGLSAQSKANLRQLISRINQLRSTQNRINQSNVNEKKHIDMNKNSEKQDASAKQRQNMSQEKIQENFDSNQDNNINKFEKNTKITNPHDRSNSKIESNTKAQNNSNINNDSHNNDQSLPKNNKIAQIAPQSKIFNQSQQLRMKFNNSISVLIDYIQQYTHNNVRRIESRHYFTNKINDASPLSNYVNQQFSFILLFHSTNNIIFGVFSRDAIPNKFTRLENGFLFNLTIPNKFRLKEGQPILKESKKQIKIGNDAIKINNNNLKGDIKDLQKSFDLQGKTYTQIFGAKTFDVISVQYLIVKFQSDISPTKVQKFQTPG